MVIGQGHFTISWFAAARAAASQAVFRHLRAIAASSRCAALAGAAKTLNFPIPRQPLD
jgi:hypothetical protein